MRLCIRSIFILTQSLTGLLDWFPFASGATTSTRSTPRPLESPRYSPTSYKYRLTKFEELAFWSGESFKPRRSDNNFANHTRKQKNSTPKPASGRRRNLVGSYDKTFEPDKSKFTRFSSGLDSTVRPDDDNDTITNTKLNGYSLMDEMSLLMADLDVNVSVVSLAKTVEVHDIVLVKLSQKKRGERYFRALEGDQKYVDEEPDKKMVLIVHGLSAMGFRKIPCLFNRESFMKLVRMYVAYLDKFDIFLVPMGNPDGIADETAYIWNKNKSPQSACSGVAIDRNFDVEFEKNHTLNPCSQQYPGTTAFSEPESRAVADLIHHYSHKIIAFIHVHGGTYDDNAYKGDALLYPTGYRSTSIEDKYSDIDAGIEESLRNAGFKTYDVSVTSMYKWYGRVTGTSVDYATSIYGIPFGMEFVMQPYTEMYEVKKVSDEISDNVLTEVWGRVIDVVFTCILKSTEVNQDDVK